MTVIDAAPRQVMHFKPGSAAPAGLSGRVLAALDTVMDPELDQPVTTLGFVRSVVIKDGAVTVHLRLPTAFCAPNFAYLMVADAYDALHTVGALGTSACFSMITTTPTRSTLAPRQGSAMSAPSGPRPSPA